MSAHNRKKYIYWWKKGLTVSSLSYIFELLLNQFIKQKT